MNKPVTLASLHLFVGVVVATQLLLHPSLVSGTGYELVGQMQGLEGPTRIALSSNGNEFVTDHALGVVAVYDGTGVRMATLEEPVAPLGLALWEGATPTEAEPLPAYCPTDQAAYAELMQDYGNQVTQYEGLVTKYSAFLSEYRNKLAQASGNKRLERQYTRIVRSFERKVAQFENEVVTYRGLQAQYAVCDIWSGGGIERIPLPVVYVGDNADGSVQVINHGNVSSLGAGACEFGKPNGIAVTADGQWVYVVDSGSGMDNRTTLGVPVCTAGCTGYVGRTYTITGSGSIGAVHSGPAGTYTLTVTVGGGVGVARIRCTSNVAGDVCGVVSGPEYTWPADNTLFTIGSYGAQFGVDDTSGSVALTAGSSWTVAVSAAAEGGRVKVYDGNGALVSSFGGAGSGNGQLNFPIDIALNEAVGEVYVTDFWNGRVAVYDQSGVWLRSLAPKNDRGDPAFNHPSGLGIDPAGNLYVVDNALSCVVIMDNLGNLIDIIGYSNGQYWDGTLAQPLDVAADGEKVYVISAQDSAVKVFTEVAP